MRLPGNGLMWGLAGSLWTEARRAPRRLATHLRCWRKLCLLARLCSGSAPLGPTAPKRTAVTSSATSGQQTLHTPVMVKEVLESLDVQPGQVVLDMTFGAGGHTKAILRAVRDVTVVALDRDPVAHGLAQQLAEEHPGRVYPLLGRFSELSPLLTRLGFGPGSVSAALLDAGCSSMQMDSAQRGFSLSKDGPLDMRMDGERFPRMPSATDVLNALDQQALASLLRAYGEERHAGKIASAILQARRVYPIQRTQQLASIVAGSMPACALYARRDRLQRPSHVATKTFQALRVFVNDELNELHAGLQVAQKHLRPCGGRLCALTFHSLEDRLVKRFLRGEDLSAPPRMSSRQRARRALRARQEEEEEEDEEDEEEDDDGTGGSAGWVSLRRKVLTPSRKELEENPRGRSAKLRAAIKR
ncbi:probable methyltransferase-like protein 15 [Clupea harengus]|uniref:12S rRNA N(4)-cytidine methyltransferase METTL15 n=1 Tax=Clupea harengus TaxID=7950 RepID=A0A6P3VM76_CLUHA|nr:probable methyltransferase-like protein 15 [Clupea harengus]XP_031442926.1 probable methyltransferase-like protein 15 [Clupea harengus]